MPDLHRHPGAGALILALALSGSPAAADPPGAWTADGWPGLAGGPHRPALVRRAAPSLAEPTWIATLDETGTPVNFNANAGVAVAPPGKFNLVVAVGRVSRPGQPVNRPHAFAFSRNDGAPLWSAPLPVPALDSFSTPAIDAGNETAICVSGRFVTALDLATGAQLWQRELDRSIVNASPCLTTDLGPANRLFITTYDGLGVNAKLFCINVDPFDAALNPFQPGAVMWSAPIGGSSGNSPAYLPAADGGLGLVYTCSVGQYQVAPGRIHAFPAAALESPAAAWVFDNPAPHGFFGGVAVAPGVNGAPPALYAATYAFSGWMDAANLVKLNAATGALAWSVPCNRTQSAPVVLPGGRIALAGGLYFADIGPSVALFQDHGPTASLVWDSALATWQDADQDGDLDIGEYLAVGGWMQQPVACVFGANTLLLAGVVAVDTFTARCPDLYTLDLDRAPTHTSFIADHSALAGASPAVAGSSIYSVGAAGLVAFGPTPDALDVDRDGARTIDDLYAWECAVGFPDVNRDGAVNQTDRALLIAALRSPVSHPQAVRR